MKHLFTFLLLGVFSMSLVNCTKEQNKVNNATHKEIPFAIIIHGGAGTIKKEFITDEKEKEISNKLQEALDAGYAHILVTSAMAFSLSVCSNSNTICLPILTSFTPSK